MTKVFLIRHAQSLANVERRYQGQSLDTELSEFGVQQAQALAGQLRSRSLSKVVTSPLKRAHQTAEIIATALGIPLEIDPLLIETNHGEWEGQKFTDLETNYPDLWKLWQTYPSRMVFPGGEAFADVAARVLSWWKKEAVNYPAHTAIVTHDTIIQAILTRLHKLNLDHIRDFRIRNTSTTIVELTRPPKVLTIGDISHLADYSL